MAVLVTCTIILAVNLWQSDHQGCALVRSGRLADRTVAFASVGCHGHGSNTLRMTSSCAPSITSVS